MWEEGNFPPIEVFFNLLKEDKWKYVCLEDEGYNDIFYCEADSRYRLELIKKGEDITSSVPFYAYTVPQASRGVWHYKAYLEKDDLKLEQAIEIIMLDEGRFALPTPEPGCYNSTQLSLPSIDGGYAYYVKDSQKWKLLDFFNLQNIWKSQRSDFDKLTRFLPIFKSEEEKKEFDEWVVQKQSKEEVRKRLSKAKDEILPHLDFPEIESASEWDKGEIYLSKVLKELLENFRKSVE